MDPWIESVLKPNEALNQDDFKLILENKDKWNPEEKVRFEKLTPDGFPLEEKIAEDTTVDTTVTDEDKDKKPDTTVAPDTTKEEKDEIKGLKTKEEIDSYVTEKKKELEAAGATKKELEEKGEQIIEFWKYSKNDEGKYFIPKESQPKDWNHAMTQVVNFLKEHPEVLFKDVAPQIRTYFRELEQVDKEKSDEYNKEFDSELTGLHKEGKIADPKTQEGMIVDRLISIAGASNGLTSMKAAYDLWSKMAPEMGGGFGYKPGASLWKVKDGKVYLLKNPATGTTTPEVDPKEQKKEQKRMAGTVGGGGGGVTAKKTSEKSYADIHNKPMSALISENS